MHIPSHNKMAWLSCRIEEYNNLINCIIVHAQTVRLFAGVGESAHALQ